MSELTAGLRRHRGLVSLVLVLLLVCLGFVALHELTRTMHLADVKAAFHDISNGRIGLALALTATSYLLLTLYDVLALRLIGQPLPWRTAAIASFTSYTISHNLGLSLVTGGSARMRIYGGAGLPAADIARVIAIAGITFWAGIVTVTGLALALHHGPLDLGPLRLEPVAAHAIGWAILAAAACCLVACALGPRNVSLFGWSIPLPRPAMALALIGVACLDLAAASLALFVLIPGADPSLIFLFAITYALAIVATLLTHVPGGLGVFEAVLLASLPIGKVPLLAALIAYRVIYYLLPLALGVTVFALYEGWQRRVARTFTSVRGIANGIAPMLMSAASFMGGGLLLLSGSTPGLPGRLRALEVVVPLPFIEASHLAASMVGAGLLLLAPGLYRRLDGAFVATRALLVAGAAFSLAKGIDYEEATVCLVIAGLLQWTSPAFYRRTRLTDWPFSNVWLACITAAISLAIWAGLFAYKHVQYRTDLWWSFDLHGDASRYMRASLGVLLTLACVIMWRLFSPAKARGQEAGVPPRVVEILQRAERTEAMLALTGDKRFLLSPGGEAFLMYQVRGASWIVMGDPVGSRAAWSALLWNIRSMADVAQGRLLLYQISPAALELAISLGLQIVKYGEEALISLPDFTIEGPEMRKLRQSVRRAEREGASFGIVPAADVPAIMPQLAAISDAWLEEKGQREKGFSLGQFDPDYLAQLDCAVVRVDGAIVAFANIWRTADGQELSIDLMRHGAGSPPGVMDYMFASLMDWGKTHGFARFSLGIAPLSGIEAHRLSPLWAKVASVVSAHGERFYGFKGLRAYKDKFAPVWEPRYIAGPRGIGLLLAVRDLGRLIGRPKAVEPVGTGDGKEDGPAGGRSPLPGLPAPAA
ncbi:MAG TPA: bifunctional lysylphosphatidylglycerol flippase/synthetase MprF [Sphingomonadaceae bacterium]|nr:bifunctional lysylphosphatidylglycerol flippase/synthetase MprF [Sphingomonadaceae bacterium]